MYIIESENVLGNSIAIEENKHNNMKFCVLWKRRRRKHLSDVKFKKVESFSCEIYSARIELHFD